MVRALLSFVFYFVALAFVGLCLLGYVRAEIALLCGVVLAFVRGDVFGAQGQKIAKHCLALSIVGMGAGMQVRSVLDAGVMATALSALGIVFVLCIGTMLARAFKVRGALAHLICVGTAICGGSAIAAAAPVMRASQSEVSVALGVVFILNAVALFVFPVIGHVLGLGQAEFGLWAAMAIHDTSSVVGAGLSYGEQALEVATTTKLVRALWIVPLVLVIPFIWKDARDQREAGKGAATVKVPWFITGFILTVIAVSIFPALQSGGAVVAHYAKNVLVVSLFLIGAGLSKTALISVGARPFVFGACLWLMTSIFALGVVFALRMFE